jgi:hypothetical protein
MRSVVITAAIVCSLLVAGQQNAQAEIKLEWSELPELPTPTKMPQPLGVAGPYVGISNDALIVAGGVSFPEPPLESSKVWHDDIYVLVRDSDVGDSYRWITGQKLERPVAYGASVSTDRGVVCIGGNDAERAYPDVFLLRWDPEKEQVIQEPLPSLSPRTACLCECCSHWRHRLRSRRGNGTRPRYGPTELLVTGLVQS